MRALPDQTMALDFTRSPDPAPVATVEDVDQVINVLRQATGWMTAREISEALGDTINDRKVRKVASAAAPQIVSYPGSPGYRLFSRCTVEEINHCINATESQGNDMIKRSVLYRTAYHQRRLPNTKVTNAGHGPRTKGE